MKQSCIDKKKKKKKINSLPSTSRQMFSHFLGSTASAHIVVVGKDKHYNHKHPPFLLLYLSWCWGQHHMLWDNTLVSWGLLPWLCHLATSYAPKAYWLGGGVKARKRENLDTLLKQGIIILPQPETADNVNGSLFLESHYNADLGSCFGNSYWKNKHTNKKTHNNNNKKVYPKQMQIF